MKFIFALLFLFLLGCETAPYTHRKQFILVSPSQEMKLGAQAYQDTLSKAKVVSTGQQSEQILRVGKRLAPYADEDLRSRKLSPFEWEFKLIDDPKTVNAWCLPGGKVAFYTGILPLCKDDAGVAAVMGHEIGHAIARHGAERMTTGSLLETLGDVLDVGFSKSSPQSKEAIRTVYGISSGLGALKFSRDQESEADHIGLMLMAKAGYDPKEALEFWKRMQANAQGSQPEFLSTHPSDSTRIANIQHLLPQAQALYSPKSSP